MRVLNGLSLLMLRDELSLKVVVWIVGHEDVTKAWGSGLHAKLLVRLLVLLETLHLLKEGCLRMLLDIVLIESYTSVSFNE
jgi:hypothetical protein